MKAGTSVGQSSLHPLLKGLPPELMDGLDHCSSQTSFKNGQTLCEAGKTANRIHLVQAGQVALEISLNGGAQSQVGLLGPGDFLGCPWFGEHHTWPLTARALGEVTTQCIFTTRLQDLFDRSPEAGKDFALRLARGMDDQLAGARNQIAKVSRIALESQVMALESFATGNEENTG
jgi:CRP/FNR family transcriptional regulator, cyclic AMP receptor protein